MRHLLEITDNKINELIQVAKQDNLVNAEDKLTEYGRNIYENIRRSEIKNEPMLYYQEKSRVEIYLPQQFLGKSRN